MLLEFGLSLLMLLSSSYNPNDPTTMSPPEITQPAQFYYHVENLSAETQDIIFSISNNYEIDPAYIISVLSVETGHTFNPNLTYHNTNGSIDRGLAQINNRYQDFYASLSGIPVEEFDPFEPEHAIRACAAGLNYYRAQWLQTNLSSTELFIYTANSYNMGLGGYKSYLKNNTIHRDYSDAVLNRYHNLKSQVNLKTGGILMSKVDSHSKNVRTHRVVSAADDSDAGRTFKLKEMLPKDVLDALGVKDEDLTLEDD